MITLHIAHLLATRKRHDFALDLQHRCAICKLDVEAVAGEGEDFFLEHEDFGLGGDELREEGDGLREGWEASHDLSDR